VKGAGICGIELSIVLRVALGDVDDQDAFRARLVDQLDRAFEHAGFREVIGELAVPRPVRRHEISLEVDQQDGGLFRLDAFRHRR
jgi:hypothetical protein